MPFPQAFNGSAFRGLISVPGAPNLVKVPIEVAQEFIASGFATPARPWTAEEQKPGTWVTVVYDENKTKNWLRDGPETNEAPHEEEEEVKAAFALLGYRGFSQVQYKYLNKALMNKVSLNPHKAQDYAVAHRTISQYQGTDVAESKHWNGRVVHLDPPEYRWVDDFLNYFWEDIYNDREEREFDIDPEDAFGPRKNIVNNVMKKIFKWLHEVGSDGNPTVQDVYEMARVTDEHDLDEAIDMVAGMREEGMKMSEIIERLKEAMQENQQQSTEIKSSVE